MNYDITPITYSYTYVAGYQTIIHNTYFTLTYSELTGDYILLSADEELRR